jgi:hypothetical protein
VLGRHVRSLRFLAIIFADEPALAPHVRFYQRLLARDEDEASVLVNRKLQELGAVGVIDQILMPAVTLVQQHRLQNEITDEDATFVLDIVAETLQQMPAVADATESTASIVALAVNTPADQLVLEMMRAAFGRERIAPMAPELSSEEALRAAIRQEPALICIAAASLTRGSELRNYCRRIRGALPDTRILVVRPQPADQETPRSLERFKEAGADCLVITAKDAVEALETLLPTGPDLIEPASDPRALVHA